MLFLTCFGLRFGFLPVILFFRFCAGQHIFALNEFIDKGILINSFLNFIVIPLLLQRLFGYCHDIKHVAFEFGLIRVFESGQVEWVSPFIGLILVVYNLFLQLNVRTQDLLQSLRAAMVKTLEFR